MPIVVDHRLRPPCPPADEREAVQKKTFTKWVNSHLGRVTCRIGDLYTDLRDGRMLIRLLEVLSGEQLVSVAAQKHTSDLSVTHSHTLQGREESCASFRLSACSTSALARARIKMRVNFHEVPQYYTLWKQTLTIRDDDLPPTCRNLALLPEKNTQVHKYT